MSTNISVSNIAWNSSNDERIADFLQRNRIKNIDIALGKYFKDVSAVGKEDLRKIKKIWNSFGISLFGMLSLLFGTERMNLFGNSEIRSDMLSHLKKWLILLLFWVSNLLHLGHPKTGIVAA